MLEHIEEDDRSADWTPAKGAVKGFFSGLIAAAIIAVVAGILARYTPIVVSQVILRAVLAFAVAWILFGVVHSAAGMVGWYCTILVVSLTMLVLVSNHIVYAEYGVHWSQGKDAGELVKGYDRWFSPELLAYSNWSGMTAAMVCAWIRHDGDNDTSTLIDILRSGMR